MAQVILKNLTTRQGQAYMMRFGGWRLGRISAELVISVSSAGELVKRAQLRAGLRKEKMHVIRKKPRVTRGLSLSDWERVA